MKDWNYVETANSKTIGGAIQAGKNMGIMFALTGDTGTGKTFAAKYHVSRIENAYYILGDVLTTKAAFLDAILEAMGIESPKQTASAKIHAIVNHVQTKQLPVLVIDDAGKLKNAVIQLIQVIYDRIEGRLGIVILGTPDFRIKVRKDAAAGRAFMPEFSGRIAHWQLIKVDKEAIKLICENNGVTEGCGQYIANITPSLHTASTMVQKCTIYASKKGLAADERLLSAMNKDNDWHGKAMESAKKNVK
jgi:type II secretory pathway predicted ATPase ExeA